MGFRTTMESTRPGPGIGVRAGSHRRGHTVAVGLLTAVTAAAYSVFVLAQYYTFRTAADDLVIFDQAVRGYSHFGAGVSIFIGYHLRFGPDFAIIADHWSPILASLAPLYWIHNSPVTLLVAQAVLFALAIPPLWVFARRALGGEKGGRKAVAGAYLVSVAYALSWPVASALAFNFHEVAFAPVLTAVALERLQAGRLRTALIALGILLLVKEDMGLLVAGIGIYLAVARRHVVRRQRLVGIALIVAGVAFVWFATNVLIPALGGHPDGYWSYSALGSNAPQAAWHLVTHPASLRLLVTPEVKLQTMLWLFGAFCFLPLRSPIALATIPLLLERMLANTSPNWWVTSFHYNAYLVVILACAAVDGAAGLDRWAAWIRQHLPVGGGPADGGAREDGAPDRAVTDGAPLTASPENLEPASQAAATQGGTGFVAVACVAAMCAVALFLVPRFAFGPALHPSFYHRNAQMNTIAAAERIIPSGVTVAAVNSIGSQLSARDTVLLWDGDGGTPPLAAPWVVANIRRKQFSFYTVQEQRQRVAFLERNGYRVMFMRGGYVVLHRVGPGAAAGH
jgi:uncharacterized membrane protein